jgi:Zn-dependent oligopeptidase
MNAQTNPLLDFSDLPRFDAFTPACVTPAIDMLLVECRDVVARLEAPMDTVTWKNFVEPLEQATEKLGRAWGVVGHLNYGFGASRGRNRRVTSAMVPAPIVLNSGTLATRSQVLRKL